MCTVGVCAYMGLRVGLMEKVCERLHLCACMGLCMRPGTGAGYGLDIWLCG